MTFLGFAAFKDLTFEQHDLVRISF